MLWQSEVPPEVCDSLVQRFMRLPPSVGTTFGNIEDYRSSVIRWVDIEDQVSATIFRYFAKANSDSFGVDIGGIQDIEIQFTEYDANYKGKYELHHDVDWVTPKAFQRKLSMVIQLSDPSEYEGGDLQFTEVESPVRDDLRKQGSVIVFPSYLQHAVSELTRGTRYSLVSWISGSAWK